MIAEVEEVMIPYGGSSVPKVKCTEVEEGNL